MDGNISFVVGTQTDGVVTRDPEEVPVAKIFDHVSPAELERFENQDFFDEDERERLLPPPKPRGRPPKSDRIVPTFNMAPVGEDLPEGSVLIKRKVGRPKGWRKSSKPTSADTSTPGKGRTGRPKGSLNQGPPDKKADRLTWRKQSVLSEAPTVVRKARGRPPRQKNLSVVIPSFNGPQPQELESIPGAESESDELVDDPKPQYSMITASGLGQSDTEDMTDQSVELVPTLSSKKRPLGTNSAFLNINSDTNGDERSPHPTKRAKTLSETSPDPIADDSAALLRQFQATVYGPDDAAKSSAIPHQQSKPSPTLDDSAALLRQFDAHTRSSSPGSSSSDSLMGPTPRPYKPSPAQLTPSNPLPGQPPFPQYPPPINNSAKIPPSDLNNNITISNPPQRQPAKITPDKPTSSNFTQRKVSLTPHYPPSTSFDHSPINCSAESRPQSSLSSASRHAPSKLTKMAFSRSTRIMPSPPKKKKPSPTPRSAPPQSSQASSTSKIGFAGIPRAKDITDYFAPKATVANTAPIKAPHSPTSQLVGPEDSESEDQLARNSSTDSLGSEIVAMLPNRITPTNQPAAAEVTLQEPSNPQDPIDLDSTEDESEDEHDNTTRVSDSAAPIQPSASSTKVHSSAEASNKAFEIEEEADSNSDSDSESDSISSEVMIIRPG